MWPAGRGQGGKGVSREHGVKPGQQVNGRAARGLTDWRGAHIAVFSQFSSVTQSCPTLCDPMN